MMRTTRIPGVVVVVDRLDYIVRCTSITYSRSFHEGNYGFRSFYENARFIKINIGFNLLVIG